MIPLHNIKNITAQNFNLKLSKTSKIHFYLNLIHRQLNSLTLQQIQNIQLNRVILIDDINMYLCSVK